MGLQSCSSTLQFWTEWRSYLDAVVLTLFLRRGWHACLHGYVDVLYSCVPVECVPVECVRVRCTFAQCMSRFRQISSYGTILCACVCLLRSGFCVCVCKSAYICVYIYRCICKSVIVA